MKKVANIFIWRTIKLPVHNYMILLSKISLIGMWLFDNEFVMKKME